MGFIAWIVLGLIVGVIAKVIMPGKDPGGFIVTILLGIAGAFVGGFIGSAIGFGSITGFDFAKFAAGGRRGSAFVDCLPNRQKMTPRLGIGANLLGGLKTFGRRS